MPLKTYRPTSPGRRGMTGSTFEEITKDRPEKPLLLPLKKAAGRNTRGKITLRHRGGGSKRFWRVIDFKRDKDGVSGRIAAVEYDPNRSARIALVHYRDGEKRYILSPNGLRVGDVIESGVGVEVRTGNCLPLAQIPTGTTVHNVELKPGRGGQLARGAGAGVQLMAKEGDYVLIRLPSGEVRRVAAGCRATIGQVGNVDHANISLGKAGRTRWLGRRPQVRGSAMNPRDHPHGGGEGKAPVGMPGPKTPWGKPALGYKTRKNKVTEKMIVRHRGKK